MAAVLLYFRARSGADRARLAREPAAPVRAQRLDARIGWYIILGTIPIGDLRADLQGPDRGGRPQPLPDRDGADRRGLVMRRPRHGRSGAVEDVERARRLLGRARAGARPDPGHLALGRDHHRRALPGLDREAAARFSFLLSIPAVVLSGLFELLHRRRVVSLGSLATATFFAFVFGYVSIAFLLRYLSTHSVMLFVWYRLVMGTVVIALVAAGVIS